MNLLAETIEVLEKHGKTGKDVLWVGSPDIETTWDNFVKVADVEYDNGFGSPQVAEDLIIFGKDFWLERREYDGSEWWKYVSRNEPAPRQKREIVALTISQAEDLGFDVNCGWETLGKINGILD
jgi:hypothetical protein